MAFGTSSKLERWQHFCRAKGWQYPSFSERLVSKITGEPCRPSLFWSPWLVGLGYALVVLTLQIALLSWWGRSSFGQIVLQAGVVALVVCVPVALSHWNRRGRNGFTSWDDF